MDVKLRCLKECDAPLMLEWMHDKTVVEDLDTDFMSKTIKDCNDFIQLSLRDDNNLHLAIVFSDDTYQGTVSLKNIRDNIAEFAITIRSSAMGKGIASSAMEQILSIGFLEKKLDFIYWYVSPQNKRALRFYKKNRYKQIVDSDLNHYGINSGNENHYKWFGVNKDEWIK